MMDGLSSRGTLLYFTINDDMRRVMLLMWDVGSRWWRAWLGPVQAQLIRLDS